MQTLEITKEAALKAHNEATIKGKTLLENLFGKKTFQTNIQDRIKTIDDAVKELGDNDPEVIEYLKLEAAGIKSHILYTQMLVVITKALNEDWTADWQNDDQWKYYPWFYMDDSSSSGRFSFDGSAAQDSHSGCGSRLCFKSRDLCEYAAKTFIDIYREFFIIK